MLTAIEGGDLPEPDWGALFDDELDREAASLAWGVTVREMREAGTLVLANAHQVKRLVLAYVQHDIAARRLVEQGAVVKAKRTAVPQYNPWFTIWKQSSELASSLEAELGISPRRRSSAGKVQRKKPAARAADAYLKPVGKTGT